MRGFCFAFAFILVAGLPVAAQTGSAAIHSPAASQARQPRPSDKAADARALAKTQSPSPYRIELLIDFNEAIDLKQLWRMLNLAPPTADAYRCEGNCEAETFDLVAGDEDQPKTVALRISHGNSHFYQYLVFAQMRPEASQAGEWKLLGHIDCLDQQTAPPVHRIERGDHHTWLVIRELWKNGPATSAYGEVWYELQASTLKRVLAYPVEGHACRERIGRSYKSFLLRHDLENGAYTIPVQWMIAYEAAPCNRPDASLALFARGQKAYYVWEAEQGQFILDAARSEISEAQVARLHGAQAWSDEAFVEESFQELADIAKSGDGRRKAWLRDFLTAIPNGPRRTELQRLLLP